jgi:hypothetical protein
MNSKGELPSARFRTVPWHERRAGSFLQTSRGRDAQRRLRPAPFGARPEFNLKYRQGEPVSFQSASRWLNARSIPELDKLGVLARWLGMEPHMLLFGATHSKVAEQRPSWQDVKPQELDLIEAYRSLSPSHRKLVRDFMAALRQQTGR